MNFKEIGRQAFNNGEHSAPILNKDIQELLNTNPSEFKKAAKAFIAGWHEANLNSAVY